MPAAIVTGASSGIGRAIAAWLLSQGWSVTAVARDPARGGLEAGPDGALLEHPADLRDERAAIDAVRAHLDRFGTLDLLVHAAGIGIAGTVARHETRHLDRQLAINLRAAFTLAREAMPALRDARGWIVLVASVAGLRGTPGLAAYGATKHGVVGLARTINDEENARGVRACAVCPAFVDTPMTEWARDLVAPGEMLAPADVVATVRYLLELGPTAVVPTIELVRTGRDIAPTQF